MIYFIFNNNIVIYIVRFGLAYDYDMMFESYFQTLGRI